MSKNIHSVLLKCCFILLSINSYAQTPGVIYQLATGSGITVLDPNGDGYISATNAGFSTDDQVQSEIPYTSLVFPMVEPNSDLGPGPDCGFTDYVDQGDQDPVQSYLSGSNNWLFRMRMGSTAPNSKSYSVLIDTDGKFGRTGPNADPNYSSSNPGFEIEIVLATNFGVFVYDVNSMNCTPVISYNNPLNIHYQKSIALTTSCGNPDYFYDFFVNFNDLIAQFGISTSTAIRMVMVDNMGANKSTLCNPASASDIAGINDALCGSILENCFEDIIDNYTPCAPGTVCPDRSTCPGINSINSGATSISGTSIEANTTVITVYKNGVSIGTTTVTAGVWTLSGISPALSSGNVITATATATSKGVSIANCNAMTVTSCATVTSAPASGDITQISGNKGYTLALTRPVGTIVRCYLPNGTLINPITLSLEVPYNLNTVTTTANPENVLFKCQTGNCFGSSVYFFTYQEPGKCESARTYDCQYSSATATTTPVITTSPILTSTTSISGTIASPDNVTGITVSIISNGIQLGTTTSTAGGAWTIAGLSLSSLECQTYSLVAIASGKCVSTAVTGTIKGTAYAPTVNSPLCSTGAITSVSGTSIEATGTLIQVYENGISEGATTTVSASGTWTASTGISIALGSIITAKASSACLSISSASNSVVLGTKSSNTVGISTSPIYECSASVSGTGTNLDVVTLYIDGVQIGATTTVASGVWTISGLSSYCELYAGGVVTATASTGSNCEGSASAGSTVVCVSPSSSLTVTPATASICSGSTVAVTVESSENGIIYQLYNGASTSGTSKLGTGSAIILTSATLTSSTVLTVKAFRIGTSCSATLSNSIAVTVNSNPTSAVLSGTATICGGNSSDLTATVTGGTSPYNVTINNGVGTISNYVSGSGISVSPFSNTTYAITSISDANGCLSSGISGTPTITVQTAPTAPVSASADRNNFCSDDTGNISLSVSGGSGSQVTWFTSSCGGTAIGVGNPLNIASPAVTTTYYARWENGSCYSTCQNIIVSVVVLPSAPIVSVVNNCDGTSILTASGYSGSLLWSTSETSPSITVTTAGTFNVTQSISGCMGMIGSGISAPKTAPFGVSSTKSICSGQAVNQVLTTSPVILGTTFTYGVPIVTGGITGGIARSVGSTADITDVLSNPTGTAQTASYTITPTSLEGCVGSTFTVVVTVNPTPIGVAATKTVCSGRQTVNQVLTTSPVVSGTTFTYAAPVVTGGITGGNDRSTGSTADITDVLVNPTSIIQTATYTITPTSPLGCVGAPFTVVVTVSPVPVLTTSQVQNLCSNTSGNVTASLVLTTTPFLSGAGFTWTPPVLSGGMTYTDHGFGTNTIIDDFHNPTTQPQTATYSVTPIASGPLGGCIGNVDTVVITVNPNPIVTAGLVQTICSGQTTNRSLSSTTTAVVYSYPVPTISGASGNVTGGTARSVPSTLPISDLLVNITGVVQTATYMVTALINGCPGNPVAVVITVNPTPSGVVSAKSICSGQSVNQALTTSPVVSGTTFTYAAPVVTGGVTGGTARSTGSTADITDALVNPTGVSQTATYTVTPTASTGCVGASFTVTITVDPTPAGVAALKTICSGQSMNQALTTSPVVSGTTFTYAAPVVTGGITGGNARSTGSAADITDVLVNPTGVSQTATYTVTPTASTGCVGANFTVTITLNPAPAVVPVLKTICSGQVVNQALTTSPVVSGTTFTYAAPVVTGGITGGNARSTGSAADITDVLVNPTGVSQTATYTVTPSASTGCVGGDFTVTITVNPNPIGVPALKTICSGQAVNQALTTSPVVSGTTFTYAAPVVTGGITGGNARSTGSAADITDVLINPTGISQTATYTVTPTASTGCVGADFTVTITINPTPNGVAALKTICSGQAVNQSLTTSPVVSGTTFTYAAPVVTGGITGGNARSTGSAADITDVLVNPTGVSQTATYTVTPTASTGCVGADFTVTITINPAPNGVAELKTICSGQAVNQSLTTSPVVLGTTFTYAAPVVTGGITGGNARSTGSAADITDVLVNPTGVSQTATYTVTPTASTGCVGADFTVTITVNPTPAGVAALKTICSGQAVNQALTTSPVVLGTTFTYAAPVVTGGITGGNARSTGSAADITDVLINPTGVSQTATYTVTPTASTGCVGADFTVTITVNPTPAGVAALKTICSGQAVNQSLTTSPVVSGTTFTYAAPVVTGGITGGSARSTGSAADITDVLVNPTGVSQTATYTITPTASTGCVGADFTVTITINPTPTTPTVTTLQSTCTILTGSITITAPISAGMTYSIDGSTYTNTSGVFTLVPIGAYIVTAKSIDGCISLGTNTAVNPQPTTPSIPILGTITQGICMNTLGSIVLSGLPSGNWIINQNGTYPTTYSSSGGSYLIPALAAGSYDFTVTNSVGCTSGATANIILKNILCSVTDATLSPVNGYTGGTAVANVLANDKLNGVAVIPSQVVLTLATALPAGITFNTSTGEVAVNPQTPAGTYVFDYTICEVLDPSNCSTTTVTVNVVGGQTPIDAINDSAASVVGINQIVTVLNVFTNDVLNGVPVNSSLVVLSQTVADSSGFMTLNSDGTVVLAPNTPAGTYTLTYKICEILNPLNCDTAVVTVSVVAPTMTVVTSSLCLNNTPYVSYTVTPDNFTPTNLLTVKWIDSANNVVATQTNLPLAGQLLWPGTVLDGNGKTIDWPGWLLVNGKWIQGSDGFELTRPAVTMEFSLNPTLSQIVNYPPATALCNSAPTFVIDAVNDLVTTAVNQQGAALAVINVFNNDTLNTVGITVADVTIAVLTSNPNLILNPNGTIDVLPNTPAGIYTLTYQICEKANSSNCDTATVTILVQIPAMTLIKTAALIGSGLAGETITYTFTVTNTGNVTINTIVINDALLSVSPIVVASSLAIGSVSVVKVNYTITQADVDFGKVVNSAIASGVDTNGTVVSVVSDNDNPIKGGDRTTVVQLDQKPSIAVIKKAVFDDNNGDGLAQGGESVTYSFKVTNTGNVPLSNVILTDLLPGIIVTGGPIFLAVGQNDTNSFKATYVITQADINTGSISNQASVTGISPKGVVVKDLSDDSDNGSDNPTVLSISGCLVEVFNAVSPNADGGNDMFYIGGIECYPDNTVEIYNRWGVLVFERSGYNNTDKAFKGESEGRVTVKQADELPAGTYYYVIKYKEFGGNIVRKVGYLYVNRK
ncbi:gliding motility-associated C-terminal domain-containing protein [Flavobacterium sp. ZT3R18]|uniref:PKD-like domain-containing protein n=1 Tax=Flavobacterium sp. ZT3R18 TaxID=2594429 RepID=UPI001179943A|nr:PKD-like domain-containing protein [Flavobacterium sp. ZT3R18]TRX36157.1 gliding motility-associated C-terminal domain-containing protein [Flavobacterium sp. ZT3R18]